MTPTTPLTPMLLLVGSFLAYHLATKSLRPDVNSLLFLAVVYAVSLATAALLWRSVPVGGTGFKTSDLGLAIALGLSLVGIEYGFIWAYRSGWPVGRTTLIGNVATTLLLVPIGWVLFRERLSLINVAGFCLCVGGLVLLSRK